MVGKREDCGAIFFDGMCGALRLMKQKRRKWRPIEMNKPLTIATAVVVVLVGTSLAMAKGPGRGGALPTFQELDVDGSGEITAEDLNQLRENRFAEMDANSDGSVSQEEFVAAAQAKSAERAARMFARLDADGDGSLSRDALEAREGRGMGERMLSRLDADSSGGVSAEEFEVAQERFAKRGKKHRGDRETN